MQRLNTNSIFETTNYNLLSVFPAHSRVSHPKEREQSRLGFVQGGMLWLLRGVQAHSVLIWFRATCSDAEDTQSSSQRGEIISFCCGLCSFGIRLHRLVSFPSARALVCDVANLFEHGMKRTWSDGWWRTDTLGGILQKQREKHITGLIVPFRVAPIMLFNIKHDNDNDDWIHTWCSAIYICVTRFSFPLLGGKVQRQVD